MSVKQENNLIIITCDKCGKGTIYPAEIDYKGKIQELGYYRIKDRRSYKTFCYNCSSWYTQTRIV